MSLVGDALIEKTEKIMKVLNLFEDKDFDNIQEFIMENEYLNESIENIVKRYKKEFQNV